MRYTLLLLLVVAAPSYAQTPGACEYGLATAVLENGEVTARVFQGGNFFYGCDGERCYQQAYTVANTPGAFYTLSLWMGGYREETLRFAGGTFNEFNLWPGPLDLVGNPPSDCTAYDRIFVVSREDVAHYLRTGETTDDLRDWPVSWGAPVLDGDGVEGNYNLESGDQPAIHGDQTAWWVSNDLGNEHTRLQVPPLGIQVETTAWLVRDGIHPLKQTSYYRFRIRYTGDVPLEAAYAGFFGAPVFGEFDDFVGSDTTRSLAFIYNGDNQDSGFDGVPPSAGIKVVHGPLGEGGEPLGMSAFTHIYDDYDRGPYPPTLGAYQYRKLRGLFANGEPLTEGDWGYQSGGAPIAFAYPGDPVTGDFWSEVNSDGAGGSNSPGLRWMILGIGPFDMEPGEVEEVVIALVYGQGSDHLDSITELHHAADIAQNAWDTGFLAPTRVEASPVPPEVPGAIELERPRPNPFTDRLTLRYTLPAAMTVRVTLLDVLGREVALLASGEQPAGPREFGLDTSGLPAGLYLVRFEAGAETRTFSVVKAR